MGDNYQKVEGEPDLAKDSNVPGVVINRNRSAYEKAVKRAENAKSKQREEEDQRDTIRNATREINTLKSEIHEIKNLLQQLVDK
jgi:DNA repair ATPase RecN